MRSLTSDFGQFFPPGFCKLPPCSPPPKITFNPSLFRNIPIMEISEKFHVFRNCTSKLKYKLPFFKKKLFSYS